MFDFGQPLVVAGFLLGLASSLHCLGMCSGIAASLCMATSPAPGKPLRGLYRSNLLVNAGRITGYVIAGMAVGGLGTRLFGVLDRSIAHIVLRWAAAVSLGWIGLSMMGAVPIPAPLVRLAAAVSSNFASMSGSFRLPSFAGLFLAGCLWGFFPCAMVYAALFYAMLSGSWLNGAAVMIGFGFGTLPPVVGAGAGLPWLRMRARSPRLQRMLGFAIIALAVFSTLPAATISILCGVG